MALSLVPAQQESPSSSCQSGQASFEGTNSSRFVHVSNSEIPPTEDCGHSHGSGEQLQLVLYQKQELVLYDRRNNRAYARHLTEEQAESITSAQHRFCPLCKQTLSPSWAFVVDGYFEMLSSLALARTASTAPLPGAHATASRINADGDRRPGGVAGSDDSLFGEAHGGAGGATSSSHVSPFASNEEAANACGLHNIPAGLLNCGYYSRFFIEQRKLGAGSFGAVYLCRHVMDDIELGVFAVKKLALGDDAKRLRQVVREVKALERLRHMNIIDYKHSWLEVSRHSEFCPYVPFLFILMEYCNAGALEDFIWPQGFERGANNNAAKATVLTEEMIWRLFLDVCRGLRHLHSRGILHRDLKPSNILLHVDEQPLEAAELSPSPFPRAMLSDLGTCEIAGEGLSHVQGGYAIEFVAPERLLGEDSEEPADMWSAGLVLYAMCFGDLPYHSDDPQQCRSSVVEHSTFGRMPRPERSAALWELVLALTLRDPTLRPTAGAAEAVCSEGLRRAKEEVIARSQVSATCSLPSPACGRLISLPPPPGWQRVSEPSHAEEPSVARIASLCDFDFHAAAMAYSDATDECMTDIEC